MGNDPQIIEYLITELANRYANGDKVAAAIALGTEAAGVWLKSKLLPVRIVESKRYMRTEAIMYETKVDENFIDAASNGRINVLQFLRKFVPYYKDLNWSAALNFAVLRNQVAVVKYILEEPLIQDKLNDLINDSDEGVSLLALNAIENNQEQILDMLLKAGADIDTTDTNLSSPLELAIYQRNPSITKLILKNTTGLVNKLIPIPTTNFQITPLILAINLDNIDVIRVLLKAGADVNQIVEGRTALQEAQGLGFRKNAPQIIELLKEHGAQ